MGNAISIGSRIVECVLRSGLALFGALASDRGTSSPRRFASSTRAQNIRARSEPCYCYRCRASFHRKVGNLKRALLSFVFLFVLVVQNGFAQKPSTPIQSADAVRVRAEIDKIEDTLPKTPDRAAALYLLAQRYAQVGDLPKALALLRECMSLDEGFDPDSKALQTLNSFPEFRRLIERTRRRHPPVHRAHVVFSIPEADLFPEGLAVDLAKHIFYMGSMYHKKIVTITATGQVSDFIKPDLFDLMPIGGIKVDPDDHTLWVCTDGPEFVHFDALGKLLDRFTAPEAGPHILNDLVLRNSREIYLTDTLANQVYRFERNGHTFMPPNLSAAAFLS
jgi:hypothetical protein